MGQVIKMPELQNILKQYGNQYKEKHDLPIYVKKTLNAIEKCRTADLGAHEDICDHCGIRKLVTILVETDIVRNVKHQQKKNGYIIKNLMY